MFYVDDRFHASEPVRRIPREHRLAAVGLWTLAGTWSAQFLKDGYVSLDYVADFEHGVELADMLVTARLWKKRPRGAGYQFVDWSRWQKTREQVETYRAAERQRKADERARKNAKRPDKPEIPGAVPTGQSTESALPHPHPSPDPLNKTDDEGHHQSGNHRSDSAHVHSPVDNSTDSDDYPEILAAAAASLSSVAGEPISKMQAGVAVDEILARGGKRVRNPKRYVVGTLRQHGAEWLQFVLTGKEPA